MQWTLGLITLVIGVMRWAVMDTSQVAQAGGSSILSDWQVVINQSPTLKAEVAIMLQRLNRSPNSINCTGVRLGHNLDPLAGYRVAPVDCQFDGWILHLEAENFANRLDGTSAPLTQLLHCSEQERSTFSGVSFKLQSWRWSPAIVSDEPAMINEG